MSRVGYARVSTLDQDPELQIRALQEAQCDKIFTEHASGADTSRPKLAACLEYLRPGDTLIVWKLDRLGRSLQHLIATAVGLRERGISFTSLTEAMDSETPQGRLMYSMMGAMAEYERSLITERVRAGIAAARANGRRGGRPPKLGPAEQRQLAQMLSEGIRHSEIAKALNVSRWLVARFAQSHGFTGDRPVEIDLRRRELVVQLHNEGMRNYEIADTLGLSAGTVQRVLKEENAK